MLCNNVIFRIVHFIPPDGDEEHMASCGCDLHLAVTSFFKKMLYVLANDSF